MAQYIAVSDYVSVVLIFFFSCIPGLGNIVSEIDVSSAQVFSNTFFSMVIPEVVEVMSAEPDRKAVVLFGVEIQVCVHTLFLNVCMLQ